MNEFKVISKPSFDYHMKMAIRSFDPHSVIQSESGHWRISTSMSFKDLKALTSVSKVIDLNPPKDIDFPEKPMSIEMIRSILKDIIKQNPLVTMETKVIERDLDGIVSDYSFKTIEGVLGWTRNIPSAYCIDVPFVSIKNTLDVVSLNYRSTKNYEAWGL